MQQAIDADRSLPFREARTEQQSTGSRTRRDLTLLDAGNRPLITGEVKMPYQPEGNSPYRYEVVADARAKARRANCEYCFTWNINRLVLWVTTPKASGGSSGTAGDAYQAWDDIAAVSKAEHLNLLAVQAKIKHFIVDFLRAAARIVSGDNPLGLRRPDDKFVEALEAALEQPILLTTDALADVYKRSRDREQLQVWMRDEQGWSLADPSDERGTLDNLNHAARFCNYTLMNKVVFHEALVRRYSEHLKRITVPDHIAQGDALRLHFESFFENARSFTGDYETVFGEHRLAAIAPRVPFYSDPAVAYWRELVNQIHDFDFSKLDYEVIGTLFERLISPEERHKFGQYYTRAEVVDLLNSYCIRTGDEKVMDPACGGGTFLVRAYARKRELKPSSTHAERLADIYGVDLSHYAANLTTINLATRDLISAENYPQIARSDFFDIEPGKSLMTLPAKIKTAGLGTGQSRDVLIPPLHAIVGNPPYVRQEDIPVAPKTRRPKKDDKIAHGTKEYYQHVAEQSAGLKLSGRSDLHIYFWPHAAEFLHDGGWLCLLTSSQWLDVDYGFRLQEYILRNFEIHAIYESVDEPWFVGARVVTCATVLRRQRNEEDRMHQLVRFVQLRRPIAKILEHDGTTAGAMAAADALRDAVYAAEHNSSTSDYRVRVLNQGDLWREGVKLGRLIRGKKEAKDARPVALNGHQSGKYFGGKWGQYVRAPDFWFELVDRCGSKLAPLAQLAAVRFGVKSGNDGFFFPIDASRKMLERHQDPTEFEIACGVSRRLVESGKIKLVLCGEHYGELRPLESELLEPEAHNLKDIKGFVAVAADCRRLMLRTGASTKSLPPHGRAYVLWGESQKWHEGKTIAARANEGREWHDLTGHARGAIFWSKAQQYRHVIPLNKPRLQCNCNLYDITPRDRGKRDAAYVLWGVLNSTFVIFAKHIFGRPVGVEGNLKTEVIDVNMMLVPDIRKASEADQGRIVAAMKAMAQRQPLNLISPREFNRTKYEQNREYSKLAAMSDACELGQSDRWELDDAVLRMLGIGKKEDRRLLLLSMYHLLRQHFIEVRRKEEKANENKKKAKKKGRGSAGAMAETVMEQLRRDHPEIFKWYPNHFFDHDIMIRGLYDTFEVPPGGEPEVVEMLGGQTLVILRKGKRKLAEFRVESLPQARLLETLIKNGLHGLVSVPHNEPDCEPVRQKFVDWVTARDAALTAILERQTNSDELQNSLRGIVLPMIAAEAARPAASPAAGTNN